MSGENTLQMHEGNCKTTRPQKFSHPRNPLTCRNWMHAPIPAPGVVTHYMQRDFNVQLGNSNVRYATSLATSLQCVIRKIKPNSHLILFTQENPRHNNFAWGPYTPTMMQTEVNLNQTQRTLSVYR